MSKSGCHELSVTVCMTHKLHLFFVRTPEGEREGSGEYHLEPLIMATTPFPESGSRLCFM